jgi:hypothetical protein
VIGRAVSFLIYLVHFAKKNRVLAFRFTKLSFPELLRRLCKIITLPEGSCALLGIRNGKTLYITELAAAA